MRSLAPGVGVMLSVVLVAVVGVGVMLVAGGALALNA